MVNVKGKCGCNVRSCVSMRKNMACTLDVQQRPSAKRVTCAAGRCSPKNCVVDDAAQEACGRGSDAIDG